MMSVLHVRYYPMKSCYFATHPVIPIVIQKMCTSPWTHIKHIRYNLELRSLLTCLLLPLWSYRSCISSGRSCIYPCPNLLCSVHQSGGSGRRIGDPPVKRVSCGEQTQRIYPANRKINSNNIATPSLVFFLFIIFILDSARKLSKHHLCFNKWFESRIICVMS